MKLSVNRQMYIILAATLWWFTAAPKPLKIEVFWGSPSPQGSYSPYILGDTTRPGHVTCVLVWSKSDRRRLRKTLHKQTNRQTNRQTDTTQMVTWPWTNYTLKYALCKSAFTNQFSGSGRAIGVMCVCVCVCRCPDFGIKWPWPRYLACWFIFTLSRSSSKVKVRGKISQSHVETTATAVAIAQSALQTRTLLLV